MDRSLGSNLGLVLNGGILESQGGGGGASLANWAGPVAFGANSTVHTSDSGGGHRDITLGGPLSGAGDLIKTGVATLRLTGDNSGHSGDIFVNQGTLLVNNAVGSGTGSGLVTVAGGAVLRGTGSIGMGSGGDGVRVLSGGTFAPGNSPGTLTIFGSLTLDPGALFQADIRNPGTDLAIVHDLVRLDGALLQGTWGGAPANVFSGNYNDGSLNWLIQNESESAIDGIFANSTPNDGFAGLFGGVTPHIASVGGQMFALFYEADFGAGPFSPSQLSSGNDLLLIAIPEPSRVMLLVVAIAAMVGRRGRRLVGQ